MRAASLKDQQLWDLHDAYSKHEIHVVQPFEDYDYLSTAPDRHAQPYRFGQCRCCRPFIWNFQDRCWDFIDRPYAKRVLEMLPHHTKVLKRLFKEIL